MKQSMVAGASMQLYLRALQSTHMELSHLVNHALNTNPALEEAPPLPADDTAPGSAPDPDATRRHDYLLDSQPELPTLSAHLEEQVRQNALPADLQAAALELIAHLDNHGFFADDPATLGLPPALLRRALRIVRDLEPAGVGARDLRDSLLLQLERAGESHTLPALLLRDHWDALVRHRYADAARALGLSEHEVAAAAHHISRLNPDPGSAFARVESLVITPDILVERKGAELRVSLTGEMVPRLVLSPDYREMMAEQGDKPEVRSYLSRCFREGRELIQAIEKRQSTILAIARAIVQRQREFFLRGAAHLLPLKMEDIAADAGLHISTVSRAVNGKFLRCDHGVYELRSFFSAALPADEGESVSAGHIRARIKALIDAEPPHKPLSDAKIESQLAAEGIRVARRTIAKYREQLHILPASLRKR